VNDASGPWPITILLTARKPNELVRAINEPSRANLFLVLLTSQAELARYLNEPDQAESSQAELARRPPLHETPHSLSATSTYLM
jgi:hypothetical protein